MRTGTLLLAITTGISALTILISLSPTCLAYDLHSVNGIQAFKGSEKARELLAKNGFAVADPAFKQIFEAYIKSPQTEAPSETNWAGGVLPSFITTDSAWDTYHVLLEEGVKQMEETQAKRLLNFSEKLLNDAKKLKNDQQVAWFASVGLALQDEHHRRELNAGDRRIVDGLLNGATPVSLPVGFVLAPAQFRAQSFYAQSPELSAYFAARQWYASVIFRLTSPGETKLAVELAELVNRDAQLLWLWKQLSNPYDDFLAKAEDGSVPEYIEAADYVMGTNAPEKAVTNDQVGQIRNILEWRLPSPRINDQLLSPNQYAEFAKQTRGFRMLPPRRLPCAVCFQNTVDPKIPGRMYPSGLDFFAASPVLRSPAAVRAVESQFGKTAGDLILKTDCGPLPESLHGEAMQLLANLQKPLPSQAPPCMRNEAWGDLQLWTQLGAWAEQRHTWALHTKLSVEYLGLISPPTGTVAPYPEFFSGLAKLTRRTAAAFEKAGSQQSFEVKTVASNLWQSLNLSEQLSQTGNMDEYEKYSDQMQQSGAFFERFYAKHRAELEANPSRDKYRQLNQQLIKMAQACAESGNADQGELETLQMYYDCRQDISQLLNNFAPVCDRLAELATKSLNGQKLAKGDSDWIENYGVTLAGFHFYYGNSYEVPRDDFPIVTRIFSNPLTGSILYAGLARPQALYVIIPDGNKLQLYRGTVMAYREFTRPSDQLLDDESWRSMAQKGETPAAPLFTCSFYAEKSASEWIKELRAALDGQVAYDVREEIFWGLGSSVTDRDLSELFQLLSDSKDSGEDFTTGIASAIAKLNWAQYQDRLINLLGGPDSALSEAASGILVQKPEALDASLLIKDMDRQSIRGQRLRLMLISDLPQPTLAASNILCQAAQSPEPGIRWQALMAISQAHWKGNPPRELLASTLHDTNEFVAAATVRAMVRLGMTNMAPIFLEQLKTVLQSGKTAANLQQREIELVTKDWERDYRQVGGWRPGPLNLLDPDNWERLLRPSIGIQTDPESDGAMRVPPSPFMPMHNFDLATALIAALADLQYTPAVDELLRLRSTYYDDDATRALATLAPERLEGLLLTTALDKQIDGYDRERALYALGNLSVTNHVKELIPLLDDTTPINYTRLVPTTPWRIRDRAAVTISIMLGWEDKRAPLSNLLLMNGKKRDDMMARVQHWAKQAQ